MFIERTGTGPRTFLGLHGWSGDHRTFLPVTAKLPEDVSFFSADLPGCGLSAPPREWTLSSVADLVAEAIWTLPPPVTIVGNCSGALLGLQAVQRAGSRVSRMVLIDMLAVFPWYFRVFLSRPIGPYAYATTFRNPLGRWFTNLSLRGKRDRHTTLTGGFARVDHAVTYKYLQLFEEYPQPESFQDLDQPIELLHGEKTFRSIRDSVSRWKSVWPQATATCLKGAGHLPIQEATAQLRGILYRGEQNHNEMQGGTCQAASLGFAN